MKKIFIFLILLLFPIKAYALDISSSSAIAYNIDTNEVVFKKDANKKVAIASMTKMMTLIISLENIENLDEEIIMTKPMFENLVKENASVAGFQVGEKVTYRDLLYGLMLPSGADAAQALAILTFGSNDKFVEAMNNKVKELNLLDTNFANSVGLDNINNYSTVYDVAEILKYGLKNPIFKQIFVTKEYHTSNNKHIFKSTILNRKQDTSLILGSKTGFTFDAGLCMASISHKDDTNLLLVTAGASYKEKDSHIKDANKIYKYLYNKYSYRTIIHANELLFSIKLDDKIIRYSSGKDIKRYLDNKCKITKKYNGKFMQSKNDKLGTKLGTYYVKCDDKVVYEKDYYVVYKEYRKKKISKYIYIIPIIIVFIILFRKKKYNENVNRKRNKRKLKKN